MTDRSELESIVQAIYQARADNDLDALMAYVHPDCSFRIAGSAGLGPMCRKIEGGDAVRLNFKELIDVWDLSRVETLALHIDGETVIAHRAGEIRFVPGDARFETEFIDKITFRDGLMVEITEFVDTLQLLEVTKPLDTTLRPEGIAVSGQAGA
ncbi:nuclear transport factor 2 family protein [Sinorhizobium terangae]|uniref:Nuclear transport factor 2 family protein n=1 Tax=Sinorhizobium terangae TaxID=110322 RepID=A0A6N7LI23_SINTE|nr:nuclear transport factor 2 family protein [Sinorhizobium terangae]MBB4185653.1 ketosteroid isomerase-like protein [Sinorhizobium terangae]MQX17521.1 nuclear transport factor 2 family protein [Sinorhizobium terangae]WFU46289.1 nuclear transport factor 2 family protein [Sinorhizobium terangae]